MVDMTGYAFNYHYHYLPKCHHTRDGNTRVWNPAGNHMAGQANIHQPAKPRLFHKVLIMKRSHFSGGRYYRPIILNIPAIDVYWKVVMGFSPTLGGSKMRK